MGLLCFVCEHSFGSWSALSMHLKVYHSLRPTDLYICGQSGCQREFHLLKTLRSHIFSQHRALLSQCDAVVDSNVDRNLAVNSLPGQLCVSSDVSMHVPNEALSGGNLTGIVNDDVNYTALTASFIAKLKSNSSIPASAIDEILNAVQEFFGGECIRALKSKTHSTLMSLNVDTSVDSVQSLMTDFDDAADMFKDLSTPYLQMKYFKENGFYIEPESYVIGSRLEAKRVNGIITLVPTAATGQHIPLHKVFQKFFQLPGVFNEAMAYMQRESQTDLYADFTDGRLWKELASCGASNKILLPYMLYFDDFETANPLGSRAGVHKLGSVYACLKCFPPKFNSKLKNLFMSLLFYSADRSEFGNEKVFGILIDEINYLQNVGVSVEILGSSHTIYFKMVQLLGDNLGLNSICGYTESFSATYYCRLCKMGKDCGKANEENASLLRNVTNYENDLMVCDISQTGIKQRAVWNTIDGYHVTNNVAFDSMHDCFEGTCRYNMGHIILYLVREKFLTWDTLNARIQGFEFDEDCNRPPVISPFRNANELVKMKASEMKCLVLNFAMMVGDLVTCEDPVWCFYLCMRQILDIVLASTVCGGQLTLLKTLVAEHHQDYVALFNDTLKPKHHFMIHYARSIMYLGPLQWIWSMRFESKHGEAKKTAAVNCNFKNICKSIAQKHQLKLSYRLMMKDAIVNYDLVVGTGSPVEIDACNVEYHYLALHGIVGTQFHANWIILDGIKFSSNKALIIGVTDDMPKFGILQDIYVDSSRSVNFIVQDTTTVYFDSHFHAYQVTLVPSSLRCIQPSSLLDHRMIHCRKSPRDSVGYYLTLHCAI